MEYLIVNRSDERYCNGCPCFYSGYRCTLLKKDLSRNDLHEVAFTPPNCPLKKVPHNIEDPRWCGCSVKEANEKAINTRFNDKYIIIGDGLK